MGNSVNPAVEDLAARRLAAVDHERLFREIREYFRIWLYNIEKCRLPRRVENE